MLALAFCAGPHRLAVPAALIERVVPAQPLEPVAGAPPAVIGLLAFAGDLLPVVDVCRLLNVASGDPGSGRLIVAVLPEQPPRRLVLAVQQAYDMVQIGRTLPRLALPAAAYLGGFSRDDGAQVQLLDLAQLLPAELRALARRQVAA